MNLIQLHKKNASILSTIYILCSILGIILSTICSLLLGSKSISDLRDVPSLVAFICNVIATILVSVVNFLQLETKINQHINTAKQLQDLEWEKKTLSEDLYIEKIKNINDAAPNICFSEDYYFCQKEHNYESPGE